jgi:diacylglycerol kinase family enzyme
MNQSFIGKRFCLAPDAKNDDGMFEICDIPRSNPLADLRLIRKIITGEHREEKGVKIEQKNRARFKFRKDQAFMADGIALEKGKEFYFRISPRALHLFC